MEARSKIAVCYPHRSISKKVRILFLSSISIQDFNQLINHGDAKIHFIFQPDFYGFVVCLFVCFISLVDFVFVFYFFYYPISSHSHLKVIIAECLSRYWLPYFAYQEALILTYSAMILFLSFPFLVLLKLVYSDINFISSCM